MFNLRATEVSGRGLNPDLLSMFVSPINSIEQHRHYHHHSIAITTITTPIRTPSHHHSIVLYLQIWSHFDSPP